MAQGNYREEFPEFGELDVELPEGFVDASWKNDAMPCFTYTHDDGSVLRLWVDYADIKLSEIRRERFCLQHFEDEDMMEKALPDLCSNDFGRIVSDFMAAISP